MAGIALTLELVNGTHDGIIKLYSMANDNQIAYKIPRSLIEEAKTSSEAGTLSNSSIYFLLGRNGSSKPAIYVGQAAKRLTGESALTRILEAHQSIDWDTVVILTTKTESLDRSKLCYLENRFYNMAKEAGAYSVANRSEPSTDRLPEAVQSSYNKVADEYAELAGVLGCLAFHRAEKRNGIEGGGGKITILPPPIKKPPVDPEIVLYTKKSSALGVSARGHFMDNGQFVVLKGSRIRPDPVTNSCPDSAKNRRNAMKHKLSDWTLLEDELFKSAHEACQAILGCSSNANDDFVDGNGTKLGELASAKQ